MTTNFDVIVVGAGHAGIEAAYVAANMGSKTLLLTLDKEKCGMMSCNPSIGGLGKGHIVYEISALGGLMPKICSNAYLQARMLNTRKGPAVQGLRLQIDKYKYCKVAKEILLQVPNLTIHEGMAIELLTKNQKVTGIKTRDNQTFLAPNVIITSGTFLNGVIHVGFETQKAGRLGDEAIPHLTETLEKAIGKKSARLKTGTPPRIDKTTVDFSKLEKQKTTPIDYLFEFEPIKIQEKIACYITQTNEKAHEIIRKNFNKSALFGGKISGIGPRYCPSIEDKVKRHPDRNSHHVFVEPDGKHLEEIYPAGLSTSLPLDVQIAYIQSIKGFECAKILKPGYAVEYDFFQPNILKHTLETKTVEGLFLAGQVIGTTGYEEAAGLGMIAGINAHLKNTNQKPFILNRTESYIGVMIDDLISIGVDEPYRMFTSRAERRLLLRQDNVFLRLMPYGKKLGLISDELYEKFLQEKEIIQNCVELIKKEGKTSQLFKLFHSIEFTPEIKNEAKELLKQKLLNISHLKLKNPLKWFDRLTTNGFSKPFALPAHRSLDKVGNLSKPVPSNAEGDLYERFQKKPNKKNISSRALLCIHAEIRYDGYLEKERRETEKVIRYQNLKIPKNINYSHMPGLSVELQQKLKYYNPETIAQAQLIPGMTPAAISILIFQTKEIEKEKYERNKSNKFAHRHFD